MIAILDRIGLQYMATIGLDGKLKARPVQYIPLLRLFKNAAHFVYIRFVIIFSGVAVGIDVFVDKKLRVEKL